MISKKLFAVVGVVALAAGLFTVTPAVAKKKCGKLCKDNYATCKSEAKAANVCKGLTGDEKKTCKAALKTALGACKTAHSTDLTACKAAAEETHVLCDSPSPAFID